MSKQDFKNRNKRNKARTTFQILFNYCFFRNPSRLMQVNTQTKYYNDFTNHKIFTDNEVIKDDIACNCNMQKQ